MNNKKVTLGRPREFDVDIAIDRAMTLFWRKGYEGTSMPDLTNAMGISRPSLYAAFGSKEKLFLRVLDRYRAEPASYLMKALEMPTAHGVFQSLLKGAIDLQAGGKTPAGCLFVQGALVAGDSTDPVRRELVKRRAMGEETIRKRYETAVRQGDLPADADPADLARFTVTILHGMAVQAAGGASMTDLRRVAEIAMLAFPK